MQLLPMDQLGPHERPGNVIRFGFLLPWVSANDGNRLFVKIIHEDDQFLQKVQPRRFQLSHGHLPPYGDFWSVDVTIQAAGTSDHWGLELTISMVVPFSKLIGETTIALSVCKRPH